MRRERNNQQGQFFYAVSLEDHILQDHLLRQIDRVRDLSALREHLAYRWFCRLGLEDNVPDHSTFSKNRHGRSRESETLAIVTN